MVVRAVIRQKIRHPGFDAEDIVQEALLAIHLKRHTWQPDLPVLPWVYAIARHKLVDAVRRRDHRAEIGLEGTAEPLVEPDPEPLMRRDVERVLDMLSPAQRAVIAAISVELSCGERSADSVCCRRGPRGVIVTCPRRIQAPCRQ